MEEAVAERLLPFCGHSLGTVYGKRGCAYIKEKAVAFGYLATEFSGVLVLTDFRDAGAICVAAALQEYIRLRETPRSFLCCFAVNELESWLLADREGLAKFFSIAASRMPLKPEVEFFPKKILIALARVSRKSRIREGVAPPPGHKAAVGPEYATIMHEFIANSWDIEAAMHCAPSLAHCVRRLRELSQGV